MKKNVDYLIEGERSTLLRFAYTGTKEFFDDKLAELAEMAEDENWTFNSNGQLEVLYKYIVHTFDRLVDENKVLIDEKENFACFNTGLLTELGDSLIGMFTKSENHDKGAYWYFIGFYSEADRRFNEHFNTVPKLANYLEKPECMYFNPEYPIIVNSNHIIEDNVDRFPKELTKNKLMFLTLFKGSVDIMKKKIARNYRLVVPQFYQKKLTYLLPLNINGYKCALAAELLSNNQYRANTVFTLNMAYTNARLLMKPETDWLNIDDIKKESGK